MLPARLADATFATVQALVDAHAPESVSLDYKAALPDGTRESDNRFLADVCAFANSRGGDMVFGVTEHNGEPTGIPGVVVVDLDALMLRLTNIVRDRIEPQVHGLEHVRLMHADGRAVVVLRVPQSWNAPHRLTPSGPFYARSANGNYQLDIEGVRAAFLASETVADRVRSFRAERVAAFVAGQGPVQMSPGPYAIFHLLPLASFSRRELVPMHALPQACRELPPPMSNGWSRVITLDGHATFLRNLEGNADSYSLVHRIGCIEAAVAIGYAQERPAQLSILPSRVELSLTGRPSFAAYTRALGSLGLAAPYIAALSLVGVKGLPVIPPGRGMYFGDLPPARSDVVLVPEGTITDPALSDGKNLRALFDRMWNTFGLERSPSFDDEDRYRRE